ncbi:MAG: hypothetical protein KBT27_16300 [Prevotellaceae bacterium]|nr:hypothetical protein [Candidatus Faecinaster equi]
MRKGIDVAQWQGTIDWKKAKASPDVQFAILKITKKSNSVEPSFEQNYKGVTDNGLPVGGYRYVYAKNEIEAKVEATALVQVLKGRKMPYLIWLDMEDASIKTVGKAMLTKIIDAEAKILKDAGYKVGIYCNKDWFYNVLDGKSLVKTYPFWIARYSNDGTYKPSLSPENYPAVAWQYSSKGKVPGIAGNVDMDVTFAAFESLLEDKAEAPTINKEETSADGYVVGNTYKLLSNMYVRDAANGNKIPFSKFSANAKANGYAYADGSGVLRQGTKVTCKGVESVNGSTWIKIPSGYVCAKTSSKVYIK